MSSSLPTVSTPERQQRDPRYPQYCSQASPALLSVTPRHHQHCSVLLPGITSIAHSYSQAAPALLSVTPRQQQRISCTSTQHQHFALTTTNSQTPRQRLRFLCSPSSTQAALNCNNSNAALAAHRQPSNKTSSTWQLPGCTSKIYGCKMHPQATGGTSSTNGNRPGYAGCA